MNFKFNKNLIHVLRIISNWGSVKTSNIYIEMVGIIQYGMKLNMQNN